MTEPEPTPKSNELLLQILAADRPAKQRLALLRNIKDELQDEPSIRMLLKAAREEKTLKLRIAFLDIALPVDITRLADRNGYIDEILYFASVEDEITLRRAALVRLGTLAAHDQRIEEVLIESLCCDLDPSIQSVCIQGLANCVKKSAETISRLLEFAKCSPRGLRGELIDLLAQLKFEEAQAGLSTFLHPSEDPDIRGQALTHLSEFPKLDAEVTRQIFEIVSANSNAELQQLAVRVLRDSTQINPDLFKAVFSLLSRFPGRTDLLEATRHRLASFPELLKILPDLFSSVPSAQTRFRILELLKDVPLVALFIKGLTDPKWQVRRMAIDCCKKQFADHPDEIGQALIEAAKAESVVVLREALARAFARRARRNTGIDRALIEWIERETEPRVQYALTLTLPAIPANGEHRAAILRAYRKIILEPFCDAELRKIVLDELGNFIYETDPELVEYLKVQLRRSASIEEVQVLYARLRAMQSDPAAHAELILELFYRFIGEYPLDIFSQWLGDFQAMAPHDEKIRCEIPYIVKLTGASWLLASAEIAAQKSTLLPALMELVRSEKTIEAVRLLEEAWKSHTLRKSDVIVFFKSLLPLRNAESVMNILMVMMARGGLVNSDVFDIGFAYLAENPQNGTYTGMMSDFLQGIDQDHTPMRSVDDRHPDLTIARKQDILYQKHVFEAFTQENLLKYWGDVPESFEFAWEAKDQNDWEYQKWANVANDWPVAKMFFALKPFDRIIELLAQPISPEISSTRSIQYFLLKKLYPEPDGPYPDWSALFLSLGTLFRNTRPQAPLRLLNDRCVLVFSTLWDRKFNRQPGVIRISPDLARMAAEIYVAVCERSDGFFGTSSKFPGVFPELPAGLDLQHLKAVWPFGPEIWEKLSNAYLNALPDEIKARELHTQALTAEEEGRFEECHSIYSELLKLEHTRYVKTYYSNLSYSKEDYDPANKQTEGNEQAAKYQYDLIMNMIEQKRKPASILHAIDLLLRKFWSTKFLTERRAELIALRNRLRADGLE